MKIEILTAKVVFAEKKEPTNTAPGYASIVLRDGESRLWTLNLRISSSTGPDGLGALEQFLSVTVGRAFNQLDGWLVRVARRGSELVAIGDLVHARWFKITAGAQWAGWQCLTYKDTGDELIENDLKGFHQTINDIVARVKATVGRERIVIDLKGANSSLRLTIPFDGDRQKFFSDAINKLMDVTGVDTLDEVNGRFVRVRLNSEGVSISHALHGYMHSWGWAKVERLTS